MQPEPLRFFRFIAFIMFLATMFIGFWIFKNYDRYFGVDPNVPSENSSARSYSKVQIFAVWAHVAIATFVAAFMLD